MYLGLNNSKHVLIKLRNQCNMMRHPDHSLPRFLQQDDIYFGYAQNVLNRLFRSARVQKSTTKSKKLPSLYNAS